MPGDHLGDARCAGTVRYDHVVKGAGFGHATANGETAGGSVTDSRCLVIRWGNVVGGGIGGGRSVRHCMRGIGSARTVEHEALLQRQGAHAAAQPCCSYVVLRSGCGSRMFCSSLRQAAPERAVVGSHRIILPFCPSSPFLGTRAALARALARNTRAGSTAPRSLRSQQARPGLLGQSDLRAICQTCAQVAPSTVVLGLTFALAAPSAPARSCRQSARETCHGWRH